MNKQRRGSSYGVPIDVGSVKTGYDKFTVSGKCIQSQKNVAKVVVWAVWRNVNTADNQFGR